MRSWRAGLALLVVLTAGASMATAGENEREARADALLEALFSADGETAVEHFNPTMAQALPAAQVAELASTLAAQLGERGSTGPARHGCENEFRVVLRRVAFERAELDAKVMFDDQDLVAGLFFVPPEDAIACKEGTADAAEDGSARGALPGGVREETVEVGASGWPVPGVFTLPEGEGPFPAVVLVHGSGPHDADQTIFANKPFLDLAHGLAGHGVASLRYVKRSKQHGARMMAETPDMTIDGEVVEDAVAAVAWLREQPAVLPDRVFVVGHSLGALLAPRIGQRAQHVAGLVLMAAPSRPLEDLVLEQVRHLAPSQGIDEAQIAQLREQRERVKALARGEEPGEGPLLLNLPASYWQSLSAYDPIVSAGELGLPMLILQGERDYQVTMADLAGWREAFADHDRVAIRSYPALNHLFIVGEGPSLPAEYMQPGHVDADLIADIARWIDGLGSAG